MPSLPDPARIQSKGFTLLSALAYVDQKHGSTGRARLLGALDEEDRRILSGHVLSSNWYPFHVQVHAYEAIDRLWGTGDRELCWEIGRFTAEHEATTIHKLFLKLARLELWLRVAGTMWGHYYSAGRLELGNFEAGTGEVRVHDFHPISRAFCHDFGGWLWRTAEMSGMRQVKIRHTSCLLDGAEACTFVADFAR
jgi:hypothetical protein